MYCVECGKELPEDANFCLKCGKPQKGNVDQVTQSKPIYETCEIVVSDVKSGFFSSTVQLWANAIGPKGSYSAGESGPFPGEWNSIHRYNMPSNSVEAHKELKKLMSKLMADGWEPTGLSNQFSFWTQTFKRRTN